MIRQYRLKDYNFKLVILLAAICTLGVLLVGSADSSLMKRQLIGCIIGFFIMFIVSLVDFSWILHFYWVIYILNLGLLIWVYLSGYSAKGAARWLQIGGENGLQFQPTELAKILLVLFFAMYFMKHEEDLNTFPTIIKAIVLMLIPLALIFRQPDLKNTITIAILFCILLYVAGLKYMTILKAVLIIVPLFLVVFLLITQTDLPILDDYQKERVLTYMDPDNEEFSQSAIQQNNSVRAIGSGQLMGKGLNNADVVSSNKGNFVAEVQNDFIFAVAGEELGFLGAFAIILLLFLIVYETIVTGLRAKNISGRLICCGVASIIALQSFINIAVATGILPNTGTPLPFISYGLTSLWSLLLGMGFVLNVGLQRSRFAPGEIERY